MTDRYPDSHVFYRKLDRPYRRIVRGEGCYLYDDAGKPYLDACGGAFVANLGHSNPAIAEALAQQARRFGYLSGTAFTHEPVEALAAELASTLSSRARCRATSTSCTSFLPGRKRWRRH